MKVYLRPTAALATVNNELLGLGDEQAEMLRGAGVQVCEGSWVAARRASVVEQTSADC